MNIINLIAHLTGHTKTEAYNFINLNCIDSNASLPTEISAVFTNLENNQKLDLDNNLFSRFKFALDNLGANLQYVILFHLHDFIQKIYNKHEPETSTIIEELESGTSLPKAPNPNISDYYDLLNSYLLMSRYVDFTKTPCGFRYPAINAYQKDQLFSDIPFCINALHLSGRLPNNGNYDVIDLKKPLYPIGLKTGTTASIPLKKGIKDSAKFFPFKVINKLARGKATHMVFLATNGKKILYVRGAEKYTPNSVLASKIATLISPIHFSSERLLDNQLIASKKLPSYVISAADRTTRSVRKRLIETERFVFPGSGLIDEVTNFIGESDPNVENYGFSSTKIKNGHLSKIDFDFCSVSKEIQQNLYEKDILTKHLQGIYHCAKHVDNNMKYIEEKLCARLKLSLLSKELLTALASKAYIEEDEEIKQQAISELQRRATIALTLFIDNPNTKNLLNKNIDLLNCISSDLI